MKDFDTACAFADDAARESKHVVLEDGTVEGNSNLFYSVDTEDCE